MAEALYVHFLYMTSMRGNTKKRQAEQVLGWGALLSTIPSDLVNGLSPGLGGTGQRFFNDRPFLVGFIIEFVDQWKNLEQSECSRLLNDPWDFKDFVGKIDLQRELFREQPTAYRPQLQALLHLVFPDTFEGIVSVRHKQEIAQNSAYADYIDRPTDDADWKIAQIRAGLEQKLGRDFDFYHEDIKTDWDPTSKKRKWDSYVEHAKYYLETGDLAKDELNDKIEIRRKLTEARKAVLAGADDWADLVKKGISGNIIHSFSQADFRRWVDESPEDSLQALRELWAQDDASTLERRVQPFQRKIAGIGYKEHSELVRPLSLSC